MATIELSKLPENNSANSVIVPNNQERSCQPIPATHTTKNIYNETQEMDTV